jgi:hypothetical protein
VVGLGPHDHEVAGLGVEALLRIDTDAIAAAGDEDNPRRASLL